MAKLPHLQLQRLDRTEDRRKPPAPVSPPDRGSASGYGETIKAKIDAAAAEQAALPKIEGIDPELILKVKLALAVEEDEWRRAGLTVLAQEPGGILVLFTNDAELKSFVGGSQSIKRVRKATRSSPLIMVYSHPLTTLAASRMRIVSVHGFGRAVSTA
jgi:hypothetical protein